MMLYVLIAVCKLYGEVWAVPVGNEGAPTAVDALGMIHDDVQRINSLNSVTPPSTECSACYAELGCFDMCTGTLSHIHKLPMTPEDIRTDFTLYSRQTGSQGVSFTYQNVTAATRSLDSPRKLVFIVHGLSSSSSAQWMIDLRESILNFGDIVVVAVDWSKGSNLLNGYPQCVVNTELVGRQIAVVLLKLRNISRGNVTVEKTHFVGHSLGAQMAKFFSEFFRTISGGLLIGRITALDAAAPCFEEHDISVSKSDAVFVDGIHTSAGNKVLLGELGVTRQVGHIDFFVNGGVKQPGCGTFDLTCSHKRAHEYYVEAIRSNGSCTFWSYACAGGLEEYRAGKCQKVPNVYNAIKFEGVQDLPGRGVEFVDTGSSPPFCE